MNLSPDQQQAFDATVTWLEEQYIPIFTFGGLGGTGKTTVLGHLAKEFASRGLLVAYATFTGRAARVLKTKLQAQGIETSNRQKPSGMGETNSDYHLMPEEYGMAFCGTLHRLLYQAIIDQTTEEVIGSRKRMRLDREYDLLVIDEASMVGDSMLEDLRQHNILILAVGDHHQLAPVGDTGALMQNPIIRLEKIHRQAEGNPIIPFSHEIYDTGKINFKRVDGHTIFRGSRLKVAEVYTSVLQRTQGIRSIARDFSQEEKDRLHSEFLAQTLEVGALCWTNKMRIHVNRTVRKALGYQGAPQAGEPLICLRNSRDGDICNGMRGILLADAVQDTFKLRARINFPFEDITEDLELCGYQFNREKTISNVEEIQRMVPDLRSLSQLGMLFDFGYAATVHKWQGSQLDHAIVICDRPMRGDEETRRFYYTAVTRAATRLTLLV